MGEEEDKFPLTDTDLMWMKVALTVASRAEISQYAKEKPNVGCVIRRSRSKGPPAVLAVGWNGFPPKTSEDVLKDKAAEYDRKGKRHGLTQELGLHAETNALRNCSENPEKATVYVTHVPCQDCAKQLVSHRVKRVFYLFWMDKSETSIQLFQVFDISCIPFSVKRRNNVLRDFSETFLDHHNICAGSTKDDLPKEGSFYLSTKDSTSSTPDLERSVSGDYGDKVDKLIQEFHKYNIKIMGMPEESSEETSLDTSDLCVSLFDSMGAKITINDIDTAERTTEGRNSNGPRPIICKFVRRLAKDSVMSVKQQACNVNPVKIGLSEDADVSKIRIYDYDEDTQEKTKGASFTE